MHPTTQKMPAASSKAKMMNNAKGTLFLRKVWEKCSFSQPTLPFQSETLSYPDWMKVTAKNKRMSMDA